MVKVEPINYGYFWSCRTKDISAFIHIGGSDYKSIAEVTKYSQTMKFRESTFITDSEVIPFLCFAAKCRLKFIDENVGLKELKEKMIKNVISSELITTRDSLTINEILVLKKILSGMSLTSIAFHTKKSIKTISSQKISTLQKLKLNNSAHSIAKLAKYLKLYLD